MKTIEILHKVSDLFLQDDEATSDWLKIPSLRRATYFFDIVGIFTILAFLIIPIIPWGQNPNTVFLVRIFKLLLLLFFLFSFYRLNYFYFKHVISENYPVKLRVVVGFFFFHLFIWSFIYSDIYFLAPDFYIYQSPPIETSIDFLRTFRVGIVRLHFFIYSAFKSLNSDFYRITSNSLVPSILNWFQTLYSLSLVGLLIASYVNQHSYPNKNVSISENDEQLNTAASQGGTNVPD